MAGTKKKESKKAGNNRKKGRCERPSHKAKRARADRRREARKARHVLHSNGQAFFDVWLANRKKV